MPEMTYVLDSEALSRMVLRDRTMAVTLAKAHQSGVRVVTSAMTLVEAYHSKVRRSAWDWAMSRVVVEPVSRAMADDAIRLLAVAGLHGHKYAIDAALAAIANRQSGRTVVFTSDRDDMEKLCGAQVLVRGL
ncbi:PIN domain-containing protein [Streptomyces sp. 130]|uniref:PIN domain-containing protein n=1 Tax=Streptomyces sp. 130 TaxID=2591006 RepID=UPI001180F5F0|nr:PIN domain-containing protein [Streptomyces sp. 130]TRV77755.1 PIN domain-containing protein [Streptomyces sp. 130]